MGSPTDWAGVGIWARAVSPPSGRVSRRSRVKPRLGNAALPASARPGGGGLDAELGAIGRDGHGAQLDQSEARLPHVLLAGPGEPRGSQPDEDQVVRHFRGLAQKVPESGEGRATDCPVPTPLWFEEVPPVLNLEPSRALG